MSRDRHPEEEALDRLKRAAMDVARLADSLKGRQAKKARAELGAILVDLGRVVTALDPVRLPTTVFDPTNPRLVGKFIGLGLVAQDRISLEKLEPFHGSGVYALYYNGPFPLYAPLRGREHPIYVGKADPADKEARDPREQGQRLYRRLKDHVRSIGKVEKHPSRTLAVSDFDCRFLVIRSGWQVAAEEYLINLFKPLWNSEVGILHGIGKHGDDPKTRANLRSPWDTIHPGRDWAHRDPGMADFMTPREIESNVARYFETQVIFRCVEDILVRFFQDLRQE